MRFKNSDKSASSDYNCIGETIRKVRVRCDTRGHVTKTSAGLGKGKTVRRVSFCRSVRL